MSRARDVRRLRICTALKNVSSVPDNRGHPPMDHARPRQRTQLSSREEETRGGYIDGNMEMLYLRNTRELCNVINPVEGKEDS